MRPARRSLVAAALALALGAPAPARAWDPSTTHQAILDEAVRTSPLHERWMVGSEGRLGLFTPLRLDPAKLPVELRLLVERAVTASHGSDGSTPRGGPGACPSHRAPPVTRRRCVEGDLWEASALTWIRLGIVAESTPSVRLLHHFYARHAPDARAWSDPELPRGVLRWRHVRGNGAPLAGAITRSARASEGPTALAWLEDPQDLLAPRAMWQHLQASLTGATAEERDRELVLGLIGLGALLHVAQDASVPAHARGDLSAFFAPLSGIPGDRGLPFQEWARLTFGRGALPRPLPLSARPSLEAAPPAAPANLRDLLIGTPDAPGTARRTATHFFSESSVPPPRMVAATASPTEAAAILLDGAGLVAGEVEGAYLTPWPSDRGYLLNAAGRPLAAWTRAATGVVSSYLDRVVYRDHAARLLPEAVETTRAILAWVQPAAPSWVEHPDGFRVQIPQTYGPLELRIVRDDPTGRRQVVRRERLAPGEHTITGLDPRGGRLRVQFFGTDPLRPYLAERPWPQPKS
jgi:hypothetical protein